MFNYIKHIPHELTGSRAMRWSTPCFDGRRAGVRSPCRVQPRCGRSWSRRLVLVTGMAYCLAWGPVVRHHPVLDHSRATSGGPFASAHFIGWGDLGSVYAAGTGLVTFPGILLLLAPVAMLTGALGMTESFPYYLAHPTAWLVLGPYEILISCMALFACDALAQRLGRRVGAPRRSCASPRASSCGTSSLIWGHPEDAVGGGAGCLRACARARRPMDGRRMALRRRRGHPTARAPHAPRAARPGGQATRHADCSSARRCLPRVAARHAPRSPQFHATCACASSTNRTSPTSTTPRRGRPLPPASEDPASELAVAGRSRTRRGPVLAPAASGGGRVVGATAPTCWSWCAALRPGPALLHRIGDGPVLRVARPRRRAGRGGAALGARASSSASLRPWVSLSVANPTSESGHGGCS